MANGIKNASGLDAADWTGATAFDEEVLGAEGRIVIVGAGGALRSSTVPVVPGQVIEAAGLVGASGGGAVLEVEFLSGGGVVIETAAVAMKTPGDGRPRRGLPIAFDIRRGRLVTPADAATARLLARGTGSAYLLKPLLDPAPGRRPTVWTPGPHTNPDLNLPSLPSMLPPIEWDNAELEPIPLRKDFAPDAGVPITRRMGSTPRWKLTTSLRMTMEEADAFDEFFKAGVEPFWIVRYDTQALCRAYWLADGEPSYSAARLGLREVSFGLLLEVS